MTGPQIGPFTASVVRALRDAAAQGLWKAPPAEVLTGYSGERVIGALQRLAALLDPRTSCYLEVGVFQGMSLLSVASACPALRCFGIDDFSQWDPAGRNRGIVEERRRALRADNARLVDRDYEDAFADLAGHVEGARVGLYFVDGPHDYRSQRVCLDLAVPFLADSAVIVIDDCNYQHVRLATHDFLLARPEFRLVFEAYTPAHPSNLDAPALARARAGWWNGIHVLVRDPGSRLPPSLPATVRDRTLYLNDHLIHGSRIAHVVPQLVDAVDPWLAGRLASPRDLARAARGLLRLLQRLGTRRPHRAANTDSAGLPATRFHEDV